MSIDRKRFNPRGAFGALTASPQPSTALKLVAAFAAVYIIWGSTYLAIRFAIETMPPLTMAGVRFTLAGAVLYLWLRARGGRRPTAADWRFAAVVGALMLLGGNGSLSWAEQVIPSGVAALIVATVPIFMVALEALRRDGERPGAMIVGGLIVGTVGIGLLVGPSELLAGERIDPLGTVVLLVGSLLWAIGSLYSRDAGPGRSPLMLTAMVMLAGGIELLAAGAAMGELGRVDLSAVSLKSGLALLYLIAFGSIVGYSAYIWLMQHATPARVSTYAYVNPVVALLLGFTLGGEALSPRTAAAAALIVGSVVAIQLGRSRRRGTAPAAERASPAAVEAPGRTESAGASGGGG
jgi:drug/metabolite transporter (DMT)-like permease